MEVYGVVYLLIDGTNDLEYVGQTIRPITVRINEHRRSLQQPVDRAIQAHGWENFVVVILKECATREELDRWEKHFIKSRNTISPNGYNMTYGGEGNIPCEKTRTKMSNTKKGKKLSAETRAKIAIAKLGKPRTAETRAKLSAARTGKGLTAETRAKIGAAFKGVPKSPEHRAKIGEGNRGKKMKPEACIKISEANRAETPYKNLLAAIVERNLSYTALAKLLGLARPNLSSKMLGRQNFTAKQIDKLVEIFNLPAEYLMARDDGLPAILSEAEKTAKKSKEHRGESPYKNLLKELDARQLLYKDLAELLELDGSTVSFKMRGKQNFTAKDRAKLEEIFGKSAEYLLARDD